MRRGEKVAVQKQLRPVKRGVKICEKQPCSHPGQCRRRGKRCSRHWNRDSPAAHNEDYGEAAVPLHPMKGPTLEKFM